MDNDYYYLSLVLLSQPLMVCVRAVNPLYVSTILVRFQAAGFQILFEIYKNFCYNIFRKVEEKKI